METIFETIRNTYATYYNIVNQQYPNALAVQTSQDYADTEEKFLEHYNNLNSAVHHRRSSIFITKKDNKITIKYFNYYRYRQSNKKWFKKETRVNFITYNTLTNKGYFGRIINYHKKRKCRKAVNQISILNAGLEDMVYSWPTEFDPIEILNIFMKEVCGDTYEDFDKMSEAILKKIYTKRGIKLSDNFFAFYKQYPAPKARDFKKAKNKFIDAIMNIHKLKGDKIRKVLHNLEHFNLEFFNAIITLFGDDFVYQLPSDDIILLLNQENHYGYTTLYHHYTIFLSKSDKINAYKLLRNLLIEFKNEFNLVSITFFDHINFYIRLNTYERTKFMAINNETLIDEHTTWTERIHFYTYGIFHRHYNSEFLNEIQRPIIVDGEIFKPVVLETSDDYISESAIQSNCVKTYIEKPNSLIISLRTHKLRATLEYRIKLDYKNSKITFKRVQSLGRFNSRLDDDMWGKPLAELDKTMNAISELNMFTLPSMTCTIGGKTTIVKSYFTRELQGGMTGNKVIDGTIYELVELKWESYRDTIELEYDEW